jgi:hypothetical protein
MLKFKNTKTEKVVMEMDDEGNVTLKEVDPSGKEKEEEGRQVLSPKNEEDG